MYLLAADPHNNFPQAIETSTFNIKHVFVHHWTYVFMSTIDCQFEKDISNSVRQGNSVSSINPQYLGSQDCITSSAKPMAHLNVVT